MADIHTKMSIRRSKASLDARILLGKVPLLLNLEISKMLTRGCMGTRIQKFASGP